MDWHRRLSLELAQEYYPIGENTILLRWCDNEIRSEKIDLTPLDESKCRAQIVRVKQGLAQTSDGRLWAILGKGQFSEWNGEHWIVRKTDKFCESIMAFIALDNRNRVWMCDWNSDPVTAIFDTATGKWKKFSCFTQALQKQLPKGITLRLARDDGMPFRSNREYFQPAFGPNGQIGFIGPQNLIFYYNGTKWRHWKPSEICPEGLTIEAPPFFDSDHHFCIQAGNTFRWQEKGGWEKLKSSEAPSPNIERPSFSLPPDSGIANDNSPFANHMTQDRQGTLWAVGDKQLIRARQNLWANVFSPDEPNPFWNGGEVYESLIDPEGNAFLRTTGFSSDFMDTFVMIRASPPPPHTAVVVEKAGEDAVRVRMSSNASGAPWFTWRLDGGAWQPLSHQKEALLTKLPRGGHAVEAQAVDEKLQPDPKSALARFEIRIDAKKQIASLIADLTAGELVQREAGSQALARYGATALEPLRAARDQAGDSQRWWIDATIQKIEREKAAQTRTMPK
jgi:hypothetical protein